MLVVTRLAGWLYRQREHRLPANWASAPADRRIRRIVVKWLMHTRTLGAFIVIDVCNRSNRLYPKSIPFGRLRQQILRGLRFLPFDIRPRCGHRNADADSLPAVVKHAEGFGSAIGQINATLDVHLRQKWAAIFYNHSDTLATKANIQDSAKGQSSVSSDEFLVVVHLAVG